MPKNKLTIGILAHVDAGKTTLCEAMLFLSGMISTYGRVDHKNAHLDTNETERNRGITIFSKHAHLSTNNYELFLMDTPGHVDFSTEAERILPILDYAILVVSGSEGVQSHTETLWKLLESADIPTFIFVNKMDLVYRDKQDVMLSLKNGLSDECIDFSDTKSSDFFENIALSDEKLLNLFMRDNSIGFDKISRAIFNRKIFPCIFGSALKLQGIDTLFFTLDSFLLPNADKQEFAARIFKVSRPSKGERLTHLKITGGSFSVRDEIEYSVNGKNYKEKITRIKICNGTEWKQVDTASCGDVCIVMGLSATFSGQSIGAETGNYIRKLEPVLNYKINNPPEFSPEQILPLLKQLEEEEPSLGITWNERYKEIHAKLMGEVQIDVLKAMVKERFDIDIDVSDGSIMYKETIAAPVEGVGHYEPLRHYAEVHLLLQPLPAGSGLIFDSNVSLDDLELNWQRLILTHLAEKTHIGVLTGSPITDMRISLVGALASVKHTEGGDFRQATYRAVRQGLMRAKSVLLEPYYSFRLEVPLIQLGRACNDLKLMGGSFSSPHDDGVYASISGVAPVSSMRNYPLTLAAYTKGKGKLSCMFSHYAPCKNERDIIQQFAYSPEADMDNPADSIFCSRGAGIAVKWDKVEQFMHMDTGFKYVYGTDNDRSISRNRRQKIEDDELEFIMLREFGPIKRPEYGKTKNKDIDDSASNVKINELQKNKPTDYLIVDGYNIIFGWNNLNKLAETDIAVARKRLMDILANYQGYKNNEIVLVFDGYRVKGNVGEKSNYHGIHIVYTRENETADNYIERLIAEIGKNYSVRVVSSDGMIQLSSVRTGVLRLTASELESEIESTNEELKRLMQSLENDKIFSKINLNDVVTDS